MGPSARYTSKGATPPVQVSVIDPSKGPCVTESEMSDPEGSAEARERDRASSEMEERAPRIMSHLPEEPGRADVIPATPPVLWFPVIPQKLHETTMRVQQDDSGGAKRRSCPSTKPAVGRPNA